jgi:hypothetical protein
LFVFKAREIIAKLQILCLQIDYECEYQKHVDDRTHNRTMLKFGNHEVAESTYVDCFRRGGHMTKDIINLVCELWSNDWNDRIILTTYVVVSTHT